MRYTLLFRQKKKRKKEQRYEIYSPSNSSGYYERENVTKNVMIQTNSAYLK